MELVFDKALYDKRALLKAAYAFTDRAYLHLAQTEKEWLVSWEEKSTELTVSAKAFENELLNQMVRLQVLAETEKIRTLMLARAMASTVIDPAAEPENEGTPECADQDILKDWYRHEDTAAF